MRLFIFLMTIFAFGSANAAAGSPELNVFGVWLTEGKASKIEISDCGDATPCGRIVWIDPSERTRPLVDDKNPETALRGQPLMGLTILYGFIAKDEQWKKGNIYDPRSGKTYSSKLRRREDGKLEVKGCVGPVCQSQIWIPSTL